MLPMEHFELTKNQLNGSSDQYQDANLLRILKGRLHECLKTMNSAYAEQWLATYEKIKLVRQQAHAKKQAMLKA